MTEAAVQQVGLSNAILQKGQNLDAGFVVSARRKGLVLQSTIDPRLLQFRLGAEFAEHQQFEERIKKDVSTFLRQDGHISDSACPMCFMCPRAGSRLRCADTWRTRQNRN